MFNNSNNKLGNYKKREPLAAIMRQRIIDHTWNNSERIPTYDELEKEFRVSRATLQQAVQILKKDGYLYSKQRQGLYVCSPLPCESRFALLFDHNISGNRFWRLLAGAATTEFSTSEAEINIYQRLSDPYNHDNTWEDIINEVNSKLIGGLIFIYAPASTNDMLLAERNDLAKIMFNPQKEYPKTCHFIHNAEKLINMGVERFKEEGKKNICFITLGKYPKYHYFSEICAKHGISTSPMLQLGVPMDHLDMTQNLIELVMNLNKPQRPDGLFIIDDNLTPYAVAKLAEMRINIPDDLLVISASNLPVREPAALPLIHLGFDCNKTLHAAITVLKDINAGAVIKNHIINPRFEN